MLGRYSLGISDRFTVGGRLEVGRATISGGLNAVRTLGRLAVVAAGAASQSSGLSGAAALLQRIDALGVTLSSL